MKVLGRAWGGTQHGRVVFRGVPLIGGSFVLQLRVWDDEALMELDDRVIDNIVVKRSDGHLGVLRLPYEWETAPA